MSKLQGSPSRWGSSAGSTPGTAPPAISSPAAGSGTLYVVRMAGHDPAPPHEEYIPVSGGIFRDFSVHDFDALRFVTGQEMVETYADGAVIEFPLFEKYGDVDTAVATFRLSGGAFGILSVTRHDPLGYDIRMELLGSGDSVVVGWDAGCPSAPWSRMRRPRPPTRIPNFQAPVRRGVSGRDGVRSWRWRRDVGRARARPRTPWRRSASPWRATAPAPSTGRCAWRRSGEGRSPRVAGAPITWGVCEVPGWGYQLEPDRVLSEMPASAFAPPSSAPTGICPSAHGSRRALAEHGLWLVAGFVPAVLHEPACSRRSSRGWPRRPT